MRFYFIIFNIYFIFIVFWGVKQKDFNYQSKV